MYLKLTNDHTASFYDNESMDAESKEFCFKINPCRALSDSITYCFVGDITANLRSFLKRFGVDIDKIDSDNSKDEAKFRFYLFQNGNIGPCS